MTFPVAAERGFLARDEAIRCTITTLRFFSRQSVQVLDKANAIVLGIVEILKIILWHFL